MTAIIRPYQPGDWPAVWAILEPVFRAADTYAVAADIDADAARTLWTTDPKVVFVAVDEADERLLGTSLRKSSADGRSED